MNIKSLFSRNKKDFFVKQQEYIDSLQKSLDQDICNEMYPDARYVKTIPASPFNLGMSQVGGFEVEINPFPDAKFDWTTKMNVRR